MMKRLQIFLALGLILVLFQPAFAALDADKLSVEDIGRVQNLLARLEPLIKEREAAQSLATLTFGELEAPLNAEEKALLNEFRNLKGDELGVTIPFRGIATGKEELVVLKDQRIEIQGKPVTLPPQAIDFISADGVSGEENPKLFEDLEEYDWLVENAGRFGFVLSYPKGQPGITFEPWHWRYENPAELN